MKPGRDESFTTLRSSARICSLFPLLINGIRPIGVAALASAQPQHLSQAGESGHFQTNKHSCRLLSGSLSPSRCRSFSVSVTVIFRSGLFGSWILLPSPSQNLCPNGLCLFFRKGTPRHAGHPGTLRHRTAPQEPAAGVSPSASSPRDTSRRRQCPRR